MVLTFEVVEEVPEQELVDFLITFLDQTMGEYSWWGLWSLEVDGDTSSIGVEGVAEFLVWRDARICISHDDGETEDEGTWPRQSLLSKELLCAALVKVAKQQKRLVSDLLSNHDLNDADTVLQQALLGEVVFG